MASTLKKGDRIRLKTPTVSGFRGPADVLNDAPGTGPDDLIFWRPVEGTDAAGVGASLRRQVVRCHDQQDPVQPKEVQG